MQLVDTSVWIHALRPAGSERIRSALRPLIVSDAAAITEWILLELMTGLRASERAETLSRWFEPVPKLEFTLGWWEKTWENAARLRRRGISVTAADCLIATIAIESRVALVHCDSDFEAMKRVLPLRTVDWSELIN